MRVRALACVSLVGLVMSMAAAQDIPAFTVLPVMLNSTLDVRHDKPGEPVAGKIMQDVALPGGQVIHRGSKILGHVVSVRPASASSPSQLILKFDELQLKGHMVPITTELRALASLNEVYEARLPTNAIDDYGTSPSDWNTVQIGGAGVYRGSGEVVEAGKVVGRATDYGAVTAKLMAAPDRGCSASGEQEQALWKFSPWACGAYGLADLKILRSSELKQNGEIALESSRDILIRSGSGWLLEAR